MAPCTHCVVSPSKPSLPSLASPADLQGTSQDTETFNLNEVPCGDPANSDSSHDERVNDPKVASTTFRVNAPDIIFFFDKTGSIVFCKECKYVSYMNSSLVF